ncbi:FadR/GntR family transcriptional regulator [Dongia deserti]|uniref:FadR/GntR family transcriptional regulator n=1 Tax=Dongia deserti TaxID=2268030 RepID=UPI0013C470CB|nr:FadR/GntR family transcriptional regulator [Dongia deserti]
MQVKGKPSRMLSQRSIHGRITHEIGQQILRGDLAPGEVLPSETDLGAEFGVSRTVLREAIKVLAAKGLVESRTKIGTRVKARDQWNMLDPDVLSWSLASHEAEDYALAVSEMRRVLEPAGAAFAAQRASLEQIARIRSTYEAMEAAGQNAEDSADHDLRFHLAILEATNNPFLVSMGHVIESAIAFNIRLSVKFPNLRVQSVPLHRVVLERIEKGDPRGAQAAMVKLLQEAQIDIERILAKPRGGRAARAASARRLRQAYR